jgi:hypothetical protein
MINQHLFRETIQGETPCEIFKDIVSFNRGKQGTRNAKPGMIISDDKRKHALSIDRERAFDVNLPQVIRMFSSEELPLSFSTWRKTIPPMFCENHIDALPVQ